MEYRICSHETIGWNWVGQVKEINMASKEFMTVKEVAELCERSVPTIIRWVSQVYPGKVEDGKVTKITIQELEVILNKAYGANITQLLMKQANTGPKEPLDDDKADKLGIVINLVVQQSALLKEFYDRQEVMRKVYTQEIKELKQKQLQIEAPKEKYMTIKGWVSIHPEKYKQPLTHGEYISLGKRANKLSALMIKDVKHVSDEVYGSVGCYSEEVLKQL